MRKGILVAGAAGGLIAVAVVLGVFVLTDDTRERTDCLVRVYFKPGASQEQIDAVGRQLHAVADASVRFVSKKKALALMRKRYPELVRDLPVNPLPASYDARTTYADSCSDVRAVFRPRPAGVENVNTRIRPFRKPGKA
jgi:cell division protein FtsX